MNERIKELASQASKIAREEHPEIAKGATLGQLANAKFKTYLVTEFDMEKFAELIVRECGQFTMDIIKAGGIPAEHANALLMAHFGVEE